jgi:hypothetical protein
MGVAEFSHPRFPQVRVLAGGGKPGTAIEGSTTDFKRGVEK